MGHKHQDIPSVPCPSSLRGRLTAHPGRILMTSFPLIDALRPSRQSRAHSSHAPRFSELVVAAATDATELAVDAASEAALDKAARAFDASDDEVELEAVLEARVGGTAALGALAMRRGVYGRLSCCGKRLGGCVANCRACGNGSWACAALGGGVGMSAAAACRGDTRGGRGMLFSDMNGACVVKSARPRRMQRPLVDSGSGWTRSAMEVEAARGGNDVRVDYQKCPDNPRIHPSTVCHQRSTHQRLKQTKHTGGGLYGLYCIGLDWID